MAKILTTAKILEENKLIAKFMGDKIDLSKWGENWKKILSEHLTNDVPNYHQSWDWLMPVAEKIGKITGTLEIRPNLCAIKGNLPYYRGNSTLEAVHKAVVAYLKYDKNKKTKKINK